MVFVLSAMVIFAVVSCHNERTAKKNTVIKSTVGKTEVQPKSTSTKKKADANTLPIVTFIELSSVNCVPCRMMKPVMEQVEAKYGDNVKVIFYDIVTDEDKDKAHEY